MTLQNYGICAVKKNRQRQVFFQETTIPLSKNGVYKIILLGAGGGGGQKGTNGNYSGGVGGAGGRGQISQIIYKAQSNDVGLYISVGQPGYGGNSSATDALRANGGNGGSGTSARGGKGGGAGTPTYVSVVDSDSVTTMIAYALSGGGGGGGGGGGVGGEYAAAVCGGGGGGGGYIRYNGADFASVPGATGGRGQADASTNGGSGNTVDFPNLYGGHGRGGADSASAPYLNINGMSGGTGGGAGGGAGSAHSSSHKWKSGGGGGGGAGGDNDAGGGATAEPLGMDAAHPSNRKQAPTDMSGINAQYGISGDYGQGGYGEGTGNDTNGKGGWVIVERLS